MLTTSAVVVLALALSAANSSSGPGPEAASLAVPATAAGNQLNDTPPAEQYFIDKIFDKYGDKGVITFEVGTIDIFFYGLEPANHTIVICLCSVVA